MSKQFKRIHTYEECNDRITVSVGEKKNETSEIFETESHKKCVLLLLFFFHFIRAYYTYKKRKERVILCTKVFHIGTSTHNVRKVYFLLFSACVAIKNKSVQKSCLHDLPIIVRVTMAKAVPPPAAPAIPDRRNRQTARTTNRQVKKI